MNESQEFKAPWGRLLIGVSGGVVLLVIWIAFFIVQHAAVMILIPLALLAALPFMVSGYVVAGNELEIKRPGWSVRFSLSDLKSVNIDPHAMKGSIRLLGNGGLFSFTGLYRNKKLGNYRAFVNDWRRSVVLCMGERTIVVSPDDPTAFAEAVRSINGGTTSVSS